VAEALELRLAKIEKPILMLGHTPAELFPEIVKYDLRPAIFDWQEAQLLSLEAVRQGKTVNIHIALDTGMSRICFAPTEENAKLCSQIAKLPGICIEGLFSHFAKADEKDQTSTLRQATLFEKFENMLQRQGISVPVRHLDNSAGVMNYGCHWDMVRAGIILYGLYPSDQVNKELLSLKSAMQWETAVSFVKDLAPGSAVSYGGTFVAEKPMRVATIPAGYADGYRRSLSGKFYVLIRGKRAPILGRICMDQFMVDVTHIPDVTTGDRVVLMGTDGDATISAEELAQAANSFNYEQVCDISRRVTRVYWKGGRPVEECNYLIK
jgi:alanine racemase